MVMVDVMLGRVEREEILGAHLKNQTLQPALLVPGMANATGIGVAAEPSRTSSGR